MSKNMALVKKHILTNIPKEILKEAFRDKISDNVRSAKTIDSVVWSTIVVDLVLPRCGIASGKRKEIILTSNMIMPSSQANFSYTMGIDESYFYEIPKLNRENSDIIQILDVTYPSNIYGTYTSPMTAAEAAGSVLGSIIGGGTQLPTGYLISGNIVQLKPVITPNQDWLLTCLIAYDNYLTNMPTTAIRDFQKLCLLMTKAYIYNELIIKIGQGEIEAGLEISTFKDIVLSYENADELFEEQLINFQGAAGLEIDQLIDLYGNMY